MDISLRMECVFFKYRILKSYLLKNILELFWACCTNIRQEYKYNILKTVPYIKTIFYRDQLDHILCQPN